MVSFCDGAARLTLPALRSAVAPLKFVLCIERSAEKNHAIAKQGIAFAPKPREACFSLALRGPEILDKIEQDVGNL